MPNQASSIRCAIYTRQSRYTPQDFSSCDAQREACVSYIEAQPGWIWTQLRYDDEGESSEHLERPALQRLLQDVRTGQVDRVVVHRLDRTSRKLLGFASLLDELQQQQIPLTVVTSPELDGTATQSLITNILMSFAEFEADLTRERMADTRRALKSKGRRVAGRVPYGYTTDPRSKQLIIVPTEASHIRAMFDLAGCGKTAREISESANRKGWHTRPSPKWPHGGAWTPRQVLSTLANPVYAGRIHNDEGTLAGAHEAIVTPEQFDIVKQQIDSRRPKSNPRRDAAVPWRLKGVIRCGQCHRAMSPSTSHYRQFRYRHYRCRSHAGGRPPCPGVSIAANTIENFVVEQLSQVSPQSVLSTGERELAGDFASLWQLLDEAAQRECMASIVESVQYHKAKSRIRISLRAGAVGVLAGEIANRNRD